MYRKPKCELTGRLPETFTKVEDKTQNQQANDTPASVMKNSKESTVKPVLQKRRLTDVRNWEQGKKDENDTNFIIKKVKAADLNAQNVNDVSIEIVDDGEEDDKVSKWLNQDYRWTL